MYIPPIGITAQDILNIYKINSIDDIIALKIQTNNVHFNRILNCWIRVNFDTLQIYNKMLEKKYLPNPLECHLGLIKFNDENEFKEGLRASLWDCDMCSYNIDVENIKIEYEMEFGYTVITFQLDENLS